MARHVSRGDIVRYGRIRQYGCESDIPFQEEVRWKESFVDML